MAPDTPGNLPDPARNSLRVLAMRLAEAFPQILLEALLDAAVEMREEFPSVAIGRGMCLRVSAEREVALVCLTVRDGKKEGPYLRVYFDPSGRVPTFMAVHHESAGWDPVVFYSDASDDMECPEELAHFRDEAVAALLWVDERQALEAVSGAGMREAIARVRAATRALPPAWRPGRPHS